jgi:hypothetical protein
MSRDSCQLCRATSHCHPDHVMSRDTVDRCLGTSLHLWGWFGIPAGDDGAVLAGVKAGALRVACGQP